MALSVEKLLTDAHTLIVHLKDHDNLADNIIASSQALYNKVEGMKQYQDDITELNEIAKHRPRSTLVLGIAQENRQIRELQQENRELQATLEEHQSALELIMQKYREHTVKLLHSNRLERALQEKELADKDSMCHLMDKIDEMAGVMQKAIEVDETVGCVDKERTSRLEVENKALREMLEICSTSQEKIVDVPELKEDVVEKEAEADITLGEEDDSDTDTECDTSIILAPGKLLEDKKEIEENKDLEEKKEEKVTTAPAAKKKTAVTSSKSNARAAGSSSPTPSTTAKGAKSPSPSKSLGEAKKSKVSSVARSTSEGTLKKSSSDTTKKDTGTGGTLKKSLSTTTKKDVKKPITGKTTTPKK